MGEHRPVGGFWGPVTVQWQSARRVTVEPGVCPPLGTQLVVCGTLGVRHGRSAALVVGLQPVTRTVRMPRGLDLAVQSFRCESPLLGGAVLAWCADCGQVWHGPASWFDAWAPVPCSACGSPVSVDVCERWHTWGACSACPLGVSDRPELLRSGPVETAAAASDAGQVGEVYITPNLSAVPKDGGLASVIRSDLHRQTARAEDRPANDAGPSAPSHGSASPTVDAPRGQC